MTSSVSRNASASQHPSEVSSGPSRRLRPTATCGSPHEAVGRVRRAGSLSSRGVVPGAALRDVRSAGRRGVLLCRCCGTLRVLARVPRIDCHDLGGLASPLECGVISTILGSLEFAWEQGQLGGASRGREEAPEVGCSDREEATREAEATEEDLARQVTTAVNRGRLSPSGGTVTPGAQYCTAIGNRKVRHSPRR